MNSFSEKLDRAIYSVFPRWGAHRIESRRRMELMEKAATFAAAKMERAWEAADNDRFRGHKWLTSRLSVNSHLELDLEEVRERAEELYRTDCYAASAINGRVDNVVGCGIRFQARIQADEDTGVDEDRATELNRQIEQNFRRWAKAERLNSKQRQAERCKALYGESFLVMSDVGSADKPVPLKIQVISPKRIETPPGKEGDPNIRLGIRFKPGSDEPVSYFIRRSEPNDTKEVSLAYDEVPAWRVCHDFEVLFPGQIRGMVWLAPAMPLLKDLKDFSEANLIAEQIAACFSVFIQKKTDPFGAAVSAATGTDGDGNRLQEISPGTIQYTGDDEEVKFADPNRPGNTLEPFMAWKLRGVAGCLRYPFELLVKQYTNNYSGGRLSLIDGRITFRCWQSQSIETTWEKVGNRFVEECVILGIVDIEPDEYYAKPWVYRRHVWVPPGWPWVDPQKEVTADLDAINGDLSSKQESLTSRGLDWEETQEQRTREKIMDLESKARIEKVRQELAAELGDDNFGREEPLPPEPQKKETVEAGA